MSDRLAIMVAVGDQVRLVAGGVSVFEVVEVLDERQALVQATADVPGRYPFPAPLAYLVPADAPLPQAEDPDAE